MRVETPRIYEDLQRKLITAHFASREKLKPADLQSAYGCSSNTVRDVLLQLSMVGLVDFEIQRGFRVAEVSDARRHDVARFRILLEQDGAARSMQKGGLAWEAALSAAHHKLKHIESQVQRDGSMDRHMDLWSDAELEFHETLISACGSRLLRETYAKVYVQFRQQMIALEYDDMPIYFDKIIAEHQAILDAALARDEAACRAAIADHLKRPVGPDDISSAM
jgi:DNA-binding GntR family transcriptional regulator